jgi:GNAT superfamily N-acetyltransferase
MAQPAVVRRLGPGDEPVLETLAREDAAFDLEGRVDAPEKPLDAAAAAAYLADPGVLHWVAEDAGAVVGFLLCHVLRLRHGAPRELLLYEIGVRATHRRRGVGRLLLGAMDAWMAEQGVAVVWVLADNPGAEAFYRACRFLPNDPQPVMLERGGD